jgi:hypothetical protein
MYYMYAKSSSSGEIRINKKTNKPAGSSCFICLVSFERVLERMGQRLSVGFGLDLDPIQHRVSLLVRAREAHEAFRLKYGVHIVKQATILTISSISNVVSGLVLGTHHNHPPGPF